MRNACILQFVTAGANPISVKKGIDKTCTHLVAKLKEHAKPVKGREDIKVICTQLGFAFGVYKLLVLSMPILY